MIISFLGDVKISVFTRRMYLYIIYIIYLKCFRVIISLIEVFEKQTLRKRRIDEVRLD